MSERAVVGTWPSGLRVIRETVDSRSESTRALALDYGFEAGAEDEFAALLRGACAAARDAGHMQLALFTSPGSPGRDVILGMATG